MAESKVEFDAIDAEPCVLYALVNATDKTAIPVICDANGYVTIVAG